MTDTSPERIVAIKQAVYASSAAYEAALQDLFAKVAELEGQNADFKARLEAKGWTKVIQQQKRIAELEARLTAKDNGVAELEALVKLYANKLEAQS